MLPASVWCVSPRLSSCSSQGVQVGEWGALTTWQVFLMAWPDLEVILSPETIFVCFKQLGLGICSLLTYWLFQFVVLSMGPVGAFSFIFFSCNFFPSSTSDGGRTSGPATLAYLVAGCLLYQRSAPSLRHIVAESWQTQPGRPACTQCAERTWSSSYPRCL